MQLGDVFPSILVENPSQHSIAVPESRYDGVFSDSMALAILLVANETRAHFLTWFLASPLLPERLVMARKPSLQNLPQPHVFKTADEIDRAIAKLQRRVTQVQELDVRTSFDADDGRIDIVESDVRSTIRDVFGESSPEFDEHKHIEIWAGSLYIDMPEHERLEGRLRGQSVVINVLNGLISRLKEKKEDIEGGERPRPSSYFNRLNLHPRINEVAEDLFLDGHHWDAVFAASKALINYVKEKSGVEKDGAKLMYEVFSKNDPVLALNDLSDQTDLDEQEGMMHLFVGASLAVRNPGGHSFPEGTEQRAIEYISYLSMLAYLVQEAKKRKKS
jgi:uncharacterized protein (TIGR02391 family)